MDMNKVLELLNVDELDESTQNELKTKIQDIIEVKAKELSESQLQEHKDLLIEEYEDKFNEYKDDITGKFSNFVDSVLDEELVIPDKVVEYARRGELYSDLIEQFKVRLAIDECLLDEEVRDLLREAKEEIMRLRDELDEKTASMLELQSDAQEMAAALYLRKKCDGLTESQKARILEILEGITDKDEIDRKFNVVLDNVMEQEEEEDEEESDDEKEEESDEDEEEEEEEVKESRRTKKRGRGISELNGNSLDEDDSPFGSYLKEYVNVLKEGI
jgi:small nuclear ribonucleoprotein (snRNP)-like protein